MNHPRICRMSIIAIFGLGSLVSYTGCSKHDSRGTAAASGSGSAGTGDNTSVDGAAASASSITGTGDPDAVNYVQTELEKHWLQTPDGWTSEYDVPGGGSQFRQIKGLNFEVVSQKISDQDKLNGIEFRGSFNLPNESDRAWPDSFASGPARWTRWSKVTEFMAFSVQKKNGEWQIVPAWDWTSGVKPNESTLATLK